MSAENNVKKPEQSESLQEFFEHYGIPLLAENLDDEYTPETLAEFSVNELRDNFIINLETAKNIFVQLERFRKPAENKKQQKGLTSVIQNLFTQNSNEKNQKPKSFLSSFENVTGIDFDPVDDLPMDPCSAANSATTEYFVRDYGHNFLTYKNFSNDRGWTPLMYACALNREGIVETILTRNPDICVQNEVKQTALMIAACFGHVSILDKLFQYSKQRSKYNSQKSTIAEISGLHLSDETGFTALHYAVYYAQDDAVRYLLNVQANPNTPDKNGMSPTLLACSDQNRSKCLDFLLAADGKMLSRNQNGQNGFDLKQIFYSKNDQKPKLQKYNHF
uniref:Ankyrin repeat protein n=1 Tax=Panagrolaimus sp. PS1159 TaxID=55785 RepID=A0AC35FUA3_9BILA